jgi:hypothetical protein
MCSCILLLLSKQCFKFSVAHRTDTAIAHMTVQHFGNFFLASSLSYSIVNILDLDDGCRHYVVRYNHYIPPSGDVISGLPYKASTKDTLWAIGYKHVSSVKNGCLCRYAAEWRV